MPPISVLIKPSSGNCNLRCNYCFYYDTISKRSQPNYGFMSEAVLEQVLQKVLAYAEGECTIAYQGGEPTLIGLDFFKKSIELQHKYNINHVKIYNAIQTNGYYSDKEWARFYAENNFLVGVSLDGGPKTHDLYRLNAKGEGSFYRVMDTISLFKKYNVQFNILSVVNSKTASQIERNYEFYKKHNLKYLQFIACLDPIGEEPGQRDYSLLPEAYGEFLIKLFHLWYQDLLQDTQPYIRQFENYISILLGYAPESCDMKGICGKQYVVEADGSVYPCDFYVMDEYLLGNFCNSTVEQIDDSRSRIGFIEKSLHHDAACDECKFYAICRGGCTRNRQLAEPYHQHFCKSYQMFFEACLPQMLEIADILYNRI
ncbi:anaerobic sulfatase maturase [Anaerocolumna xylanovorans]|uniref:Radical SAM core domain-containing protein n=1 Tax=Anaerocolumna xylanovorans DSM 12503 TaxID=1121345 RepID=A0A1M7YN49_9FIRM|nr:anaerobic sulfatase maturase [Anaerocolumna xylanovorans]SHO54017.1 uncharacterized protein SAMN02745217_04454 [Anaerocolumna xylanovorans DSM 12503]